MQREEREAFEFEFLVHLIQAGIGGDDGLGAGEIGIQQGRSRLNYGVFNEFGHVVQIPQERIEFFVVAGTHVWVGPSVRNVVGYVEQLYGALLALLW